MTTRRPDKTAAPPNAEDPSASNKLLTSEDLFGDMVDGPPEPVARPAAAAPATRKGPIKVQVSEPGVPRRTRCSLAADAGREAARGRGGAARRVLGTRGVGLARGNVFGGAGIEELIDEGSAALAEEGRLAAEPPGAEDDLLQDARQRPVEMAPPPAPGAPAGA